MRVLFRAILAVICLSVLSSGAFAQLEVNNIEIIDSSGEATDATVLTQTGASILVRNDFSVDLLVRVKDAEGELVTEMTVSPGAVNVPHGLSAGKYTICAKVAGSSGDFEEVGCIAVRDI